MRGSGTLVWCALFMGCGQPPLAGQTEVPQQTMTMEHERMITIDIWSDVVCPFCYIGKRELERALERFPERDKVRVVWHSFELDPQAPERSELDMYGMLVEKYGGTREEARARVAGVVQRAKGVGLVYDMDRAVIGSSYHAHRLLQFAKTQGRGEAMKERLFRAYFSEGVHLADRQSLTRLAVEVGLPREGAAEVLAGDAFADAVRADEREAMQRGVRGVPYFLIDGRAVVNGAQDHEVFLRALRQAWDTR